MASQKQKLTKRQKESKRINRQRAVRQWLRNALRRVALVCLALGIILGIWLWRSGKAEQMAQNTSNAIWQDTANMGFRLDTIYLEGRGSTPLPEITRAMNVTSGTPILHISLKDMRDRLETIPRIKYAEVTRVLPDQLHIRIVEREPIAIWQNNGRLHLIDDDGVVMEYEDPAQYKNLLLIVGEDAPAHTHELLTMLASEPELYKNVAAVLRIGDRRWDIRFKNDVELKLPEKDADQAWQNFASIEHEHHLLERAIKSVDMRLSDRIFIQPTQSEITPAKYTPGGSEI